MLQGYKPDYMYLLQRTMMDNPDAAVNLAKMIAKQPGPPIELNIMSDLFLQRNMVREATAFLLDVLSDNNPEYEKLQTKVSLEHSSSVDTPKHLPKSDRYDTQACSGWPHRCLITGTTAVVLSQQKNCIFDLSLLCACLISCVSPMSESSSTDCATKYILKGLVVVAWLLGLPIRLSLTHLASEVEDVWLFCSCWKSIWSQTRKLQTPSWPMAL